MKKEEKTKQQLLKDIAELERKLSELKEIEKDFREKELAHSKSEERFKQIAENAKEWIWEVDIDGLYTYSSPVAEKILGYKPDEIVGKKHFFDLFHPEDKDRLKKAAFEVISRKEPFREFINRNIDKSGEEIWLSTSGVPILDKSGNLIGYRGADTDVTERIKSETALRESEERYRQLFENAPVGVYRTTPEGKIIMANRSLVEMMGYSSFEEMTELNLEEDGYAKKEDRSRFKDIIEKNGEVIGLESIWKRKDGSFLFVRENARVVRDEAGKARFYEGVVENITARKKAEMALQRSEEKYRNLVERANDGICIVQDTLLKYVNPRFSEIIGYSKEELTDTPFMNYIHPAELNKVVDRYKRRMAGEEVISVYETALLDKDNERVDVELNAGIIDYEGHPADFVFVRDITKRKRAEKDRIESERKYRALFEQASEAVFLETLDGEILDINRHACDMLGYKKGELVGLNIKELIPEDELEKSRPLFAQLYAGKSFRTETYYLDKEGKKIPVEVNAAVVTIENEKRVFALVQDITERKELEEQLRRSQKSEAMGRLAGGIAHDFNNVLTAIFGYVDLLKQSIKEDHKCYEYIDEIGAVADKAATLTQQLLAFSKKQILEPVVLDINEVVEEMAGMLKRIIGENISFKFTPAIEAPPIKVDKGQLEQVILNLVVNARDAMPEGGEVRIATKTLSLDDEYVAGHPEAQSGEYILLTIEDTGTGIPDDIKDRIFDPFFTTKETGTGTGLGLPTVFGIVKQSGGYIDITSEKGRGTKVEVYFPSVYEPIPKPKETPTKTTSGGPETVLVVEDDESVRKTVAAILRNKGYDVIDTVNGAEAIKNVAFSDKPVDLLITDVVMPHVTGKDLAQKLLIDNPNLKILYISGYTDEDLLGPNIVSGNSEFLQKPFTASSILRKVRDILDR